MSTGAAMSVSAGLPSTADSLVRGGSKARLRKERLAGVKRPVARWSRKRHLVPWNCRKERQGERPASAIGRTGRTLPRSTPNSANPSSASPLRGPAMAGYVLGRIRVRSSRSARQGELPAFRRYGNLIASGAGFAALRHYAKFGALAERHVARRAAPAAGLRRLLAGRDAYRDQLSGVLPHQYRPPVPRSPARYRLGIGRLRPTHLHLAPPPVDRRSSATRRTTQWICSH
jgi:hypothetical protein